MSTRLNILSGKPGRAADWIVVESHATRTLFYFPYPFVHIGSIYAIAVLFIGAGLAHFLWPEMFARVVPPYFPRPLLLVYLSGVAEVVGGAGVLIPAARPYAGWGLLLLLCAVFPVHVYMVRRPDLFPRIPLWMLYVRLPLQFVLMAWVYWAACRPLV